MLNFLVKGDFLRDLSVRAKCHTTLKPFITFIEYTPKFTNNNQPP